MRAVDALGNPGPVATRSWTVDTVPPPAPVLTDKPDDPNGSAISTFTWTDAEAGVTFECSIENGPYGPCSSPFTFEVIVDTSNNGQHQFAVRAIDTAGNRSSTTTYQWKVDNTIGFTITGNASGLLYPGLWRPLVLTLHNPHNFTIYVTLLQTAVADAPGCAASPNVQVQQSDIDSTVAKRVAVPSNGSAPVPAAASTSDPPQEPPVDQPGQLQVEEVHALLHGNGHKVMRLVGRRRGRRSLTIGCPGWCGHARRNAGRDRLLDDERHRDRQRELRDADGCNDLRARVERCRSDDHLDDPGRDDAGISEQPT